MIIKKKRVKKEKVKQVTKKIKFSSRFRNSMVVYIMLFTLHSPSNISENEIIKHLNRLKYALRQYSSIRKQTKFIVLDLLEGKSHA